MRLTSRKDSRDDGFTLVETLVTVGLMAMLLSVYLTVLGSLFFLRRLQFNIQAANFVQEEIETLRSLSFDDLTTRTDGHFLGLPIDRGSWHVEDIDMTQGNAMVIDTAETAYLDETALLIVPGNYRTDGTFTTKVRIDGSSPNGWGAAIAFRYIDAENHYRLRLTSGGIAFDQVSQGTVTTLWSQSTSISKDIWYELSVDMSGSDFQLFRDAVDLGTHGDTEHTTGDLALMALNDAVIAFDDVSVAEITVTTWDFESDPTGSLPAQWQRLSYENLPGGGGNLTISDYLGNAGIKEITVEVTWLDSLFPKSMAGTTLIAQ